MAARPIVAAIVVCRDGRPFIRETLRGLNTQRRPVDHLLVLDTGSRDGTAERLRRELGPAAVASVRGQFGRAVMAALANPAVARSEWLWLLHDDAAPDPEALERLLAAAEGAPDAAVLGPKLVAWYDPGRLSELGWAVDRTGRRMALVDDGELDQGQHDRERDVFFVSTAGMLVRRHALLAAGGFDPRMQAFGDDTDLCWRVHLLGGRVLAVPAARVRHFRAASVGRRRTARLPSKRYLYERHALAAALKSTSARRLPLVLLLSLYACALRVAALTATGRPGEALQIIRAWGWNLVELPETVRQRRTAQRSRRVRDRALAKVREPGYLRLVPILAWCFDWLAGRDEEEAEVPPGVEPAEPVRPIRRWIAHHPLLTAFAGLTLVMAIALRGVLVSSAVAGGALGIVPSSAHALWASFIGALRPDQLGTATPAPPAVAVYALGATITLGKPLLAEKLLLLLAVPLAAVCCARALRALVPDAGVRAVTGTLYATTPVVTGALAQGRLGELAFLVLGPPVFGQVLQGLRVEQPREAWRPALRLALLSALVVALWPPALGIIAVVVLGAGAVAVARAGRRASRTPGASGSDRSVVVRRALLLVAGLTLGLVLLLPWSVVLVSGSSPLTSFGAVPPAPFAGMLALRPGGAGQPGWLVGAFYPLAALAAPLLAVSRRRAQSAWCAAGYIGCAAVAAWQVAGWPAGLAGWGEVTAATAAICWAGAVAIGLDGVWTTAEVDRFGWSQVATLLLGGIMVVTGVGITAHLLRGAWQPLGGVNAEALPATVTLGDARVLWLGGLPDGAVGFAVTGPLGRTVTDGGELDAAATRTAMARIVTDILGVRTDQIGQVLSDDGVGFVAVRPGPDAARLTGLLARQHDLQAKPVGTAEAALYQGPAGSPAGVLLAGPVPDTDAGGLAPVAGLLAGAPGNATGLVHGPETLLVPVARTAELSAGVAGRRLAPATAFGWEQAFVVPAGVSGRVVVHDGGQPTRDALLVAELVLVLTALAALARPTRRPAPLAPSIEDPTELAVPKLQAALA